MSLPRSKVGPSAPSRPVVEWRRDRLVAAGFAPDAAAQLAEDCGIDLHAIFELTDRGCQPDFAARILAPSDDEHRPC